MMKKSYFYNLIKLQLNFGNKIWMNQITMMFSYLFKRNLIF